LIVAVEWGSIEVEGLGLFKDVKVWPGGGREWDWRETGTRHRPGIQPADVVELLDHGATAIVLGTGMEAALGVSPDVVAELERKGIVVEVLVTPAAVDVYNAKAAHEAVGGLFHSTC
jgi:hypothetical protein